MHKLNSESFTSQKTTLRQHLTWTTFTWSAVKSWNQRKARKKSMQNLSNAKCENFVHILVVKKIATYKFLLKTTILSSWLQTLLQFSIWKKNHFTIKIWLWNMKVTSEAFFMDMEPQCFCLLHQHSLWNVCCLHVVWPTSKELLFVYVGGENWREIVQIVLSFFYKPFCWNIKKDVLDGNCLKECLFTRHWTLLRISVSEVSDCDTILGSPLRDWN